MAGRAGDDDAAAPSEPPTSDTAESAPEATLRLTSSGCAYEGPDEVRAGTQVRTRLVNATDADAGFVLVEVPEGSTYAELAEYIRLQTEAIANGERSVPPPSSLAVVCVDLPQLPPQEEEIHSFSFPHGTYAYVCLEQMSPPPRRDLAIYITEPIVAQD